MPSRRPGSVQRVNARARTRGRTKPAGRGGRHDGEPAPPGDQRAPGLAVASDLDLTAVLPGFTPESDLERAVTSTPELREGLAWGRPRPGHPEGPVGAHVAHLLEAIDREPGFGPERRSELRFLALVHDAFKNRVQEWRPKTGENHHATRARRFAERFVDDERLLATLELHDRPYALWRKMRRKEHLDEAAFAAMMSRVPDPDLFLCFIELDGGTEGKHPEPVRWFREELARRGILG
jgi:hypothetical protein